MRIIYHQPDVAQPKALNKRQQNAASVLVGLVETPVQEQARLLYNAGLNVFPQPIGKKSGYSWKKLQYTRLHPTDQDFGLYNVFAGRCNIAVMCGKTSDNLFVLDCETSKVFKRTKAILRKRKIPIWAVRTARGGHIYLRCADGEVANVISGIIQDIEVRGSRCYVLAPPSVHPSGMIYQWDSRDGAAPPLVKLTDIDWLTDKNGSPIKLQLVAPRTKKKHKAPNLLSRTTQDYLNNGHTISEGSRNNRLFNAACDMAGNQYNLNEVSKKLTPLALTSGLSLDEIERTIQSAFSQHRTPSRPLTVSTTTTSSDWQRALTFAETYNWKGRTATSDKAVFLALIKRAQLASNETGTFRASVREVSELARLSSITTQKALRRLRSNQLVQLMGSDKTSTANLWRFAPLVLNQSKSDTLCKDTPWQDGSVSVFNSDAVERGALGHAGLQVYRIMVALGRPMMPKLIAQESKLRVHQVNYALKKLKAYGLAERVRKGWIVNAASDEQLDQRVARPAGTLGKAEARKERYRLERARHAGQLIFEERLRLEFDELHQVFEQLGMMMKAILYENGDLKVDEQKPTENSSNKGEELIVWECPNCGQSYFGETAPDMCDFCRDFTTWRRIENPAADTSDPVIETALALGAEVRFVPADDSSDSETGKDDSTDDR